MNPWVARLLNYLCAACVAVLVLDVLEDLEHGAAARQLVRETEESLRG